jgi:hypothetical protein
MAVDIFGLGADDIEIDDSPDEGNEPEAEPTGPDEGHPAEPEGVEANEPTEPTEPAAQPQEAQVDTAAQAAPAEPKKWAGKYDSPDLLESAHVSLQETLGRQSQELGALRAMLRQQMQEQQAGVQHTPQMALRNQQPVPQPEPDEDPEKWNERFFQDPRSVIRDELQRASRELGQAFHQTLTPLQQVAQRYEMEQAAKQRESYFSNQEQYMKQKYGAEYEKYKPAMADLYETMEKSGRGNQEIPYEEAFKIVRYDAMMAQQAQAAQTQAQQAQDAAAKAAAATAVAKPTGQQRVLDGGKLTPEDAIRQATFRSTSSGGGMWSD